jgi:hypothetical protein
LPRSLWTASRPARARDQPERSAHEGEPACLHESPRTNHEYHPQRYLAATSAGQLFVAPCLPLSSSHSRGCAFSRLHKLRVDIRRVRKGKARTAKLRAHDRKSSRAPAPQRRAASSSIALIGIIAAARPALSPPPLPAQWGSRCGGFGMISFESGTCRNFGLRRFAQGAIGALAVLQLANQPIQIGAYAKLCVQICLHGLRHPPAH